MRAYWSVEYRDPAGDPEIKHAFLTDGEARSLTDQAVEHGVVLTLYKLTAEMPGPVRPGDVLSADGIREPLGLPASNDD